MILIVSSLAREAALLTALCEQRSWPCQACNTAAGFAPLAENTAPFAVVLRHRLQDGHSDDIIKFLQQARITPAPRIIVLVPADCSIRQEARQVALGADCVLRDPVRMEVLLEYLNRYRTETGNPPAGTGVGPLCFGFGGVRVFPHEHRLARLGRSIPVAPQEIGLLQLLARSPGKVVPYPVLYCELFNRRFAGDTANCRVLLGKATASFRRLGADLRTLIKVIPKSGYLYSPRPRRTSGRT